MMTAAPTAPGMPRRWPLGLLLFTGMVVCYAQRGALSVAAPAMVREMGISRATMGVLLSAFFWTYSFLQVPAGWFVDRLGVKRAYAVGYGLWSVASAVTGFVASRTALVAVRMLVGVGQAVAFPASARVVVDWFPEKERGTVTAVYLTGVRIGQALVGGLGTLVLAAWGTRIFFLVAGVAPLIWLLFWIQVLGRREGTTYAAAAGKATSRPPVPFLASLALLRQRTVVGIFLGFFAYDYAWFVYVSWLPGYLALERHFGPREMALYSSAPYVAMSVVILLAGAASDGFIRRGHSEIRVRKVFISAGLLVACLIVPAGLVEDEITAVWLLTISLCGLGIASASTWTLTQAVCPKEVVGAASGIQNFGGNLGGILAPALTGYIAHVSGSFALALGLTGIILVGGILAYCFLISRNVELAVAE